MLAKAGNIISRDWSDYDGNHKSVIRLDSLAAEDLTEAKNLAYVRWGEHQKKRRGFSGNLKRFRKYAGEGGLFYAVKKSIAYLRHSLSLRARG